MKDNQFLFSPSVWLVPLFLTTVNWAIYFTDLIFRLHFDTHGILPRTFSGLQGVIFSPFLHGDFNHLLNNTFPLFILTAGLIYFYRNLSLKVLVYGIVLSGLITWLIGRNAYHIGASGLIYVLVSFLFFKGFYTRYFRLMALSFTIVLIYGGLVWYVFPQVNDQSMSWEGHLAGSFSGFLFARYFKTPNYHEALKYDWQKPNYNPEEDKFMMRFDENGHFVNPPPPENAEEINYVYDYKEKE